MQHADAPLCAVMFNVQAEHAAAPAPRGEFRNVTFRYPDMEHDALYGVSLIIDPGETLAVVGKNGSGKTTMMNLLSIAYTTRACLMTFLATI